MYIFVLLPLIGLAFTTVLTESPTDALSSPSALSLPAGNSTEINTNSTTADLAALDSTCTNENWSNGSAFFVLVTLAIGCLVHPKGSLVFSCSDRAWRLSPLFVFMETCCISWRLFYGLRKGFSLRVVCCTLLALRLGNTWHQYQFDDFFKAQIREGQVEEDLEDDDQGQDTRLRLPPRSSTSALEEGIARERDVKVRLNTSEHRDDFPGAPPALSTSRPDASRPRSMGGVTVAKEEWFKIGHYLEETLHESTQNKVLILFDQCFVWHMKSVQGYERGTLYRLLIWVPMMQQAIKLCLVSGAPFTRTFGFIFFLSWLLVEFLLAVAARGPLTRREKSQAIALGQKWRNRKRISWQSGYRSPGEAESVFEQLKRQLRDIEGVGIKVKPTGIADSSGWAIAAMLCANGILFDLVWFAKGFVGYSAEAFLSGYHTLPLFYKIIDIPFIISTMITVGIIYPGFLFICIFLPLSILSELSTHPFWISSPLGRLLGPYYIYSATNVALQTAFITLVVYAGFREAGRVRYKCWNTSRPSYYDWLG